MCSSELKYDSPIPKGGSEKGDPTMKSLNGSLLSHLKVMCFLDTLFGYPFGGTVNRSLALSLWRPLVDTPPLRNKQFMGPCKAQKGTDTKVASAKGHFCASPNILGGSLDCGMTVTNTPCAPADI